MRKIITVGRDGSMRFIYDDNLRRLLDHGHAAVRRASHVEPGDPARGQHPLRWYADLRPSGGEVLGCPAGEARSGPAGEAPGGHGGDDAGGLGDVQQGGEHGITRLRQVGEDGSRDALLVQGGDHFTTPSHRPRA